MLSHKVLKTQIFLNHNSNIYIFKEPKWWLAFKFSKLELRIELDEPRMGHIGKLDE